MTLLSAFILVPGGTLHINNNKLWNAATMLPEPHD